MIIVQNQPQKKLIEETSTDSILIGKGKKHITIGDLKTAETLYLRALNFNVSNFGNDFNKPMSIGLSGYISPSKTDTQIVIGGHYNPTNPATITINIGGKSAGGYNVTPYPVFKATNKTSRSVEINYIVEPNEREIKPMIQTLQNNGVILYSKSGSSAIRLLDDNITIMNNGEMLFDMQNNQISIGTPSRPVNGISLSPQGVASLKSQLGIA